MIKRVFKYFGWHFVVACLLCGTVETVAAKRKPRTKKTSSESVVEKTSAVTTPA